MSKPLNKIAGSLWLMTIGPNPMKVELVKKLGRVVVTVPPHQHVEVATTRNLHGWKMKYGDNQFLIDLEEVEHQ